MTIIERWLPLAVTTIDRSTVLQYSYTYVQLLQHVHVVQHGTRKFPCATKGPVYDIRLGSITELQTHSLMTKRLLPAVGVVAKSSLYGIHCSEVFPE